MHIHIHLHLHTYLHIYIGRHLVRPPYLTLPDVALPCLALPYLPAISVPPLFPLHISQSLPLLARDNSTISPSPRVERHRHVLWFSCNPLEP